MRLLATAAACFLGTLLPHAQADETCTALRGGPFEYKQESAPKDISAALTLITSLINKELSQVCAGGRRPRLCHAVCPCSYASVCGERARRDGESPQGAHSA